MSLTRRNWFLHRAVPASALFAAGAAGLASAGAAAAAQNGKNESAFWDERTAASGPKIHVDKRTGASVTLDKSLPVHPHLQYAAQVAPTRKIRVILQKRRAAASGHAMAQSVGGRHLEEFSFIKSHVLEIPAKAAYQLALNKDTHYVSPDALVHFSAVPVSNLKTAYPGAVNAPATWNSLTAPATGQGVTVAVLDSGINKSHPALSGSNVVSVVINAKSTGKTDANGHGTHVTGIVTGYDPTRGYIGIAPDSRVISVQIADDQGMTLVSDLLRGLQWVEQNKATYNIKAVNLSINGSLPESYLTSPTSAAVELLWMKGVVVVVAAGNRGSVADAVQYAPACDPFVISVGATFDNGSASISDDTLADFSSRGTTMDGFAKPDVVAPGRQIVAPLAGTNVTLARSFPDRISDSNLYIRLSGTSMAAPVVTGMVALILERYPSLTPNQVKWLLANTARSFTGKVGNAGLVDISAALQRASLGGVLQANQGLALNLNLQSGQTAVGGTTSAYWDSAYWDSAYWDSAYWDSAYWDSAYWDAAGRYDMVEYDTVAID
ncbi:MAG TPA: S8 family serine peptidase [Chloroflexota bacterium]|nr:S8 family serine peptidase [Chloroflexota bacterium]